MRKKFTMLFAALLAFAGVAKAGVTDLPQMSEGENFKWYTISNTRSASGKYLYWTESGVKDSNERTGASFVYVTGSTDACYIHNYATDLLFSGDGAWTKDGVACKLTVSPLNTGLMIGFNSTYLNEKNYDNGFTTWGDINDEGSVFVFEEVTDFSAIINVPAAKEAAIAELNNLATVSVIYSAAVTSAVNEINAVTPASNGLKDLNDAVETINAIVVNYRNAAYQALDGKFFTIMTPARNNKYMQMTGVKVVGTPELAGAGNLWQFIYNNGAVNIYNPYIGKYLCEPGNNSAVVNLTAEQASAGAYAINVIDESSREEKEKDGAVVKFTCNNKSIHMTDDNGLVRWDNGGASEWNVEFVTNFSDVIAAHKETSVNALSEWEKLSVVFDAALIEAAEAAINGIETTDWATFAAIDAELTKVTDAVAAKMFVFQTKATDAGRNGVWISADPVANKAIGADNQDYNAIWSLRHVTGSLFYIYNELNKVYIGGINDAGTPLTTEPMAAYSFEIVDAAANLVELKNDGKTLHASNHADNKLLNWDDNEDASRWMVNIIDVAKDIQDLLDTIEESDYAVVPALGQYPTAAYDALVEARTSARTVEDVETAIAAFKAAKNLPVFTIDGVIDYAAGKSVYDDQDGAPNFKATNVYDKTMWWVFDQTKETIGVTESVNVINYATRKGFWGAEALKIAETSDAVEGEDDGIYLFYTVGNGTPLHYQNDNQVIVRWSSTGSTSGSATRFTHIGNTYDLDKLTDAHIAALPLLQAAYDAKAFYADAVLGEGLGQYKGTEEGKAAIVATLAPAEAILNGTLSEQANATVDAINSAAAAINEVAALEINLPETGKFYRFQGACEASLPGYYITGHTNADGGRIALTAEADASTIYYFDGTNLTAYQSGLVVGLNSGHWTFASIGDNSKPASTITFAGSPRQAGKYTIKSADRYFHYTVYNGTVQVNRCQDDVCKEHDWTITEVTELPVAITAAGYATLYAPVALTIAEGVTAYTATIAEDDKTLDLNEVENTIPANTGVILKADPKTYNFAVAADVAAIKDNVLVGSFAKSAKNPAAKVYTLQMPNKEDKESVGFYLFKGYTNEADQEGTKTYINGFRAWIEVAAGEEAPAMFSFGRGQGTTSIENALVNTENAVIYDLAGRRVAKMEKGIYIVNGRKVVVK